MLAASRLTPAYADRMPTQTAPRTPLAEIPATLKLAVVRRVVGKSPVVAPLEVAAFSSSI